MVDFLQAHKDEKERRADLNTRRDNDGKMVTSFAYVMKGTGENKEPIPDVINITMNRVKVFKAYVLAALHKADEKSFVDSENTKVKKDKIKDYVDAAFASANYQRYIKGEVALEPYFDDQACMMGELDAKVIFQIKQGEQGEEGDYLDTEITPQDTQFVAYNRGSSGLAWHTYEKTKSKGEIESEPWFEDAKIDETGKEAVVLDLWTPEENKIYIAEKEVFKQPNIFGYVPICVQKVPIGSMSESADNLKYQMESIFFLIRDFIEEYYRCISVLQTLNFLAIKQATQEVTDSEEPYTPDQLRPGSNVKVDYPNAISSIPYGKAERSMILALQEINKAINDGTLARITLGDLPGELSAVALIQIEQGQGQVYMPRLGARGLLKEQIATMLIKQSLLLGSVEMGVPGHKKPWKMSDLEGDYKIGYTYTNKSPETDFARVSMQKSYVNVIDEESILKDVLKRDDPKGDLKKLNRQRLRILVPNLQIYDGLMALAEAHEEGDESAAAEIAITEAQLGVSAEQMLAGNLPQQGQQPAQPSELPLLANKGSAQGAADLIRTPEEEVEE
ncbi:hypothetical protein LCGC14_1144420 [marine sediment metagenome]|uniref:Portal protein n=1 Tax=marine sediment metagenome TaxID=412755 RepID=A0A0F9Q341_9ZZZZ